MATRQAQAPAPNAQTALCDFCHQKQPSPGFAHCSKHCAGLAAMYCINCRLKPKYQNFPFCGRSCATQASGVQPRAVSAPLANSKLANVPSGLGGTYQILPTLVQMATKGAAVLKGQANAVLPATSSSTKKSAGPAVPQSLLQAAQHTAQAVFTATVPAMPIATNQAPKVSSNNPFINPTTNPIGAPTSQPKSNPATQYVQGPPAVCLIPGCGKPVHVDPNAAQSSEYCSTKHREEAVTSGLIQPCIMCLTMPQGETDYFCGRACRDEALCRLPANDT